MRNRFFFMCIALLCAICSWAQKSTVWNQPAFDYSNMCGDGFFNTSAEITKVEMTNEETKVYMHISLRSDYPDFKFQFDKGTNLQADGKKYPIVYAEGMPLGEFIQTNKDGKLDVVFHFKPLPLNTLKFDLTEGDFKEAFRILGITSVEERQTQLFPSYWRNEHTGNWDIAFFDDCVIYDSKFWSYKQKPAVKNNGEKANFVICNGDKELQVKVGKNKNGKRTIQIGNSKVLYSMVNSRFMPDYPVETLTTDTKVSNSVSSDSTTIIGWLKDMPDFLKQYDTFDFNYCSEADFDIKDYNAKIDSLGRFSITFPLSKATEMRCDWKRTFIRTIFEPGKTYFLLWDFKEGRRYFMGNDARVQNELLKYPFPWGERRMERGEDAEKYMASVDSLIKTNYKQIDNLRNTSPTLSTRFIDYQKGSFLSEIARQFGQARFSCPQNKLPKKLNQYAHDMFWEYFKNSNCTYYSYEAFVNEYIDDVNDDNNITINIIDFIDELNLNEAEKKIVNEWKQKQPDVKDSKLQKAFVDIVNKKANTPEARAIAEKKLTIASLHSTKNTLDSLDASQQLKDAYLAKQVYELIDYERCSIAPEILDTLKALVVNPKALEKVIKANDTYLAIEKKEFDRSSLKSNDNLDKYSEGAALLQKIIEPYKGKLVLLDIWGTWCSPCKEALSHSQEEYERLAPYDIVYLYLAKNSPKESWENVIKQYNVTGDNVVHYNLPQKQQTAIEQYLKIQGYPSYRLFDKQGNLLEVNADPRDLEGLAKLIDKLP